jgi:hypothetical protein
VAYEIYQLRLNLRKQRHGDWNSVQSLFYFSIILHCRSCLLELLGTMEEKSYTGLVVPRTFGQEPVSTPALSPALLPPLSTDLRDLILADCHLGAFTSPLAAELL